MNSQNVREQLTIVVPTLNEEANVEPLVAKIFEQNSAELQIEVLFVDGGSTDRTCDVVHTLAKNYSIRLIDQDRGAHGLAAAIMGGARAAKGDILIVMDADLSHPPEQIGNLLAPIFAGSADIVIGSRYVAGGSTPGWPLWRRVMSRAASALAYPLTGVSDSMCGFFAIPRARLLQIAPPTSGFKIVFETIVRGGRDLRVREIPIVFHNRARGRSKMSFGVAARFFLRWLIAIAQRALPN